MCGSNRDMRHRCVRQQRITYWVNRSVRKIVFGARRKGGKKRGMGKAVKKRKRERGRKRKGINFNGKRREKTWPCTIGRLETGNNLLCALARRRKRERALFFWVRRDGRPRDLPSPRLLYATSTRSSLENRDEKTKQERKRKNCRPNKFASCFFLLSVGFKRLLRRP